MIFCLRVKLKERNSDIFLFRIQKILAFHINMIFRAKDKELSYKRYGAELRYGRRGLYTECQIEFENMHELQEAIFLLADIRNKLAQDGA